MLYWQQIKAREVSAMQLELRHAAEQNAKRYRENLSYLRGYEAAADAGRSAKRRRITAGWREAAGGIGEIGAKKSDSRFAFQETACILMDVKKWGCSSFG